MRSPVCEKGAAFCANPPKAQLLLRASEQKDVETLYAVSQRSEVPTRFTWILEYFAERTTKRQLHDF